MFSLWFCFPTDNMHIDCEVNMAMEAAYTPNVELNSLLFIQDERKPTNPETRDPKPEEGMKKGKKQETHKNRVFSRFYSISQALHTAAQQLFVITFIL